jgi:transposase
MAPLCYRRHRFPPEIIQHAIWLYLRFTLSYRDVEELLAERGLDISYETVRRWVLKFGPAIARRLRQRRPRPSNRWHLDEMVVRIAGERLYLWRAVDDEGEVLDMLVQCRRDSWAALRLLRKLLKKQGFVLARRPTGERFVAARVADAANDVLAAKLFQIVCGAARTVLCTAVVAEAGHANPCADPFRPVIGARRRPPCGAPTVRFAADSLLEQSGFELVVPLSKRDSGSELAMGTSPLLATQAAPAPEWQSAHWDDDPDRLAIPLGGSCP